MYDKEKIGKRIARGGDAVVYKYGLNKVIKFSTLSYFLKKRVSSKLIYDYNICKEYLGNYIIDVQFELDERKNHIEIQEYIEGRPLELFDISNNHVSHQIQDIFMIMNKMSDVGISDIDLVGNNGIFKSRFGNIFIDKKNNLHIIDAALLESKSIGFLGYILTPIIYFVIWYQKKLIEKFLEKM